MFEKCPKISPNQGRGHPALYLAQDPVHSLNRGHVQGLLHTQENAGTVLALAQDLIRLGMVEREIIQEFIKIVTSEGITEVIEDHTISAIVEEDFIHVVSIIAVDM